MIIYISFDLSNADNSKEISLFQEFRDQEIRPKGFLEILDFILAFNWIIKMLFFCSPPEIIAGGPTGYVDLKIFGNIPTSKYLPQLNSSFLFSGKL